MRPFDEILALKMLDVVEKHSFPLKPDTVEISAIACLDRLVAEGLATRDAPSSGEETTYRITEDGVLALREYENAVIWD
ncbi:MULTISPECIES: hypothetical protein [unclassified Ruegeria]|uniref:hypothetical protein n=1 Tax=unclassified Ruegeria TaxID=2625375 RepID=UPI001489898E|nr:MULTISPECIES: hypothetical protein [unclassified Ruegeria]